MKGPSPFEPGPSSHVVVKLFLELRLSRPCRRSIAFTKTVAASAITPLDKTRGQVIAPAIAANQFVRFRLTAHLLLERPLRLGLFRDSLPGRLHSGRPRRVYLILLGW